MLQLFLLIEQILIRYFKEKYNNGNKKKETIAEALANGIYDALYDKENRTPIDASATALVVLTEINFRFPDLIKFNKNYDKIDIYFCDQKIRDIISKYYKGIDDSITKIFNQKHGANLKSLFLILDRLTDIVNENDDILVYSKFHSYLNVLTGEVAADSEFVHVFENVSPKVYPDVIEMLSVFCKKLGMGQIPLVYFNAINDVLTSTAIYYLMR